MPGAPVPASAQPAGNRPAASGQPPSPAQSAATVGHTALPPRQHIRCFECGYEFNLTGRQHSTYCPKCRTTLDLAGYTIDAECRETLKTLGKIRVTPRGSVSSATLMATDMDLQGKVSACNVTVFRLLTVFPGASFVRHEIKTVDLRIEPGTGFSLRKESAFRNVDLAGTLNTNLYSTGVVTLRSTSEFKGEIHGAHLVVEDGAVVQGSFDIRPEALPEVEKVQKRLASAPTPADPERIVVPALPEPAAPAEDASPAKPSAG